MWILQRWSEYLLTNPKRLCKHGPSCTEHLLPCALHPGLLVLTFLIWALRQLGRRYMRGQNTRSMQVLAEFDTQTSPAMFVLQYVLLTASRHLLGQSLPLNRMVRGMIVDKACHAGVCTSEHQTDCLTTNCHERPSRLPDCETDGW